MGFTYSNPYDKLLLGLVGHSYLMEHKQNGTSWSLATVLRNLEFGFIKKILS